MEKKSQKPNTSTVAKELPNKAAFKGTNIKPGPPIYGHVPLLGNDIR